MPLFLLVVLMVGMTKKRRPVVEVTFGEPVIVERAAKPGW